MALVSQTLELAASFRKVRMTSKRPSLGLHSAVLRTDLAQRRLSTTRAATVLTGTLKLLD